MPRGLGSAPVRISAKVDYAVRAVLELASADGGGPMKGEAIASAQQIPRKFLEAILGDLRRAGIVGSQRGAEGGYRLARPASEVAIADIIRAVEGPLADVRGIPPEAIEYPGVAEPLQRVWIATRASLREVLEATTVADVAAGSLPAAVDELAQRPDAWQRR
jgi:Rrf2 family protein